MAKNIGAGAIATIREERADESLRDRNDMVELVIVGAGISGIGMGIAIKQRGWNSFALLEAAKDIGGTWRDNTYPGVAVDTPSSSYCFSFETDFPWSRTFAPGHEVQSYIRHCVEKYGIERHIRFGSLVEQARFDVERNLWEVRLRGGERMMARFLVAATGLFSTPVMPDVPGLELFEGKVMHSARWDHTYDFANRRVGIIGTGASAVQIVPELSARVSNLTVFQRTPIHVAPRFDYSLRPDAALFSRTSRYWRRFLSEFGIEALSFVAVNYRRYPFLTHAVQRLVRRWMRQQVRDSLLADKLVPEYDLGCKRPTISNAYLSSFNERHVSLIVDPIAEITRDAVICRNGARHPVEALVLATGFRTTEKGNAPTFEVIGREGQELGEFWDNNRRQAYAGIAVAGFPNFFLTAGPYSGGLNWFAMLETNLGQIIQCLEKAATMGAVRIEVDLKAYRNYVDRMWLRAQGTVFKAGDCTAARSYYIDRHGDASLPSPRSPGWRARRARRVGSSEFRFTDASRRETQ